MAHFILPYLLALFGFAAPVYPLQDVDIRPRETTPTRAPVRPTKERKASVATNGVLFVLTAPRAATVTVKNIQGGEVKRETIEDGEFRTELVAGTYDIEIAAAGYYPKAKRGVVVRPPRETIERADLNPTTGLITIGLSQIDPDTATILIDNRSLSDANIKVRIKKEENQIELDNVEEGYHTLTITHPSIARYTKERLEVRGGSITFHSPVFIPAVVTFTVKSEPGATIFIDGNNEGRTQDNGMLKVSNSYSPGPHTIRAEIDGKFEPNEVKGSFNVGEQTVEVKLTSIVPSPEYSMSIQADTLQDFWDAPPTWQVIQGKMVVGGADAGLLKERRWMDFTWIFDITFINDKGACWIVRARDKQNYYLFQLGGLKGAAPRYFRSYIFQNGRFKLLDNVPFVEDLSSPKDSYQIKVEASGPTIKHFIQRKNDPAPGFKPVHTLTDDKLPYGTVGFQAKDGEEFNVFSTFVTPNKPRLPATR